MSKQKFESMWKVMKENHFEIPHDINSEFTCTICKGLLIDACNAPCGCRYCRQCISEYLNDECKHCPGTSESCKDEEINIDTDIHVDQVINNRISKLIIQCPNTFCQTQLDIKSIENHLKTCIKEILTCPFTNIGCEEDKLPIDKVNEHLLSEINSHTKLLMDWVNISRNEMELLKKDIQQLRSDNDDLKSINNDLKEKVETNENTIRDLQNKDRINTVEIEKLSDEVCALKNTNRYRTNEFETSEIQNHERLSNLKLRTKIENQIKLIHQSEQRCQTRQTRLDEKLKIQHNKNQNFETKLDELSQANDSLKIEFKNSINYVNYQSREFVWKIENWSEKRDQAQKGVVDIIYSDPFFSHKNGYTLRLFMFPDGNYHSKGTHVSIYFQIMKGPFDDILPWPFYYNVQLTLVDQHLGMDDVILPLYGSNISYREEFAKPTNETNNGYGFPQFIELASIPNHDDWFLNNQVFIKCFVQDE